MDSRRAKQIMGEIEQAIHFVAQKYNVKMGSSRGSYTTSKLEVKIKVYENEDNLPKPEATKNALEVGWASAGTKVKHPQIGVATILESKRKFYVVRAEGTGKLWKVRFNAVTLVK